MQLEVFFDYSCPYTDRFWRALDELDVGISWRAFSLAASNAARGQRMPWEVEDALSDARMLALAGHELVRCANGNIHLYLEDMFDRFHGDGSRPDREETEALIRECGINEPIGWDRALEMSASSYREAKRLGTFGSPTVVVDGKPVFVKLSELPDDAEAMLQTIISFAKEQPELAELKRPQ